MASQNVRISPTSVSVAGTALDLALALDGHPGAKVRVCGAGLVDAVALGNEPLELVEVLLAALMEVAQLEVLRDEEGVGAVGDVVLENAFC